MIADRTFSRAEATARVPGSSADPEGGLSDHASITTLRAISPPGCKPRQLLHKTRWDMVEKILLDNPVHNESWVDQTSTRLTTTAVDDALQDAICQAVPWYKPSTRSRSQWGYALANAYIFLTSGHITTCMMPREGKKDNSKGSSSLLDSAATFTASCDSQTDLPLPTPPVARLVTPLFTASSPNRGRSPSKWDVPTPTTAAPEPDP